MSPLFNNEQEKSYWSERYDSQNTGWDIGHISTPLKAYFDQLANHQLSILIPGAGNAYEAEYLVNNGFTNVTVLDIAAAPLEALRQRVPSFTDQQLIQGNFFDHQGQYDLVIEQTFFCSFPPIPDSRQTYAQKMYDLLKPGAKLVGLWFDIPLTGDMVKRPFGGSKEEYLSYFSELFDVQVLAPCYNSIPPRQGNELFGIFVKKAQF